MKTLIKDGKTYADIKDLSPWVDNPRFIKDQDFEELKASIKSEGQLTPLLVNSGRKWGKKGIVLGGNMSYKAMLALNYKDVWINFVTPIDRSHAVRLALKHNAHYGQYDVDLLAELALQYPSDTELMKLNVHIANPISLEHLRNSYGPGEPDPATLQDKTKKLDAEEYANASIKQIVLYFSAQEYAEVTKILDTICQLQGVKNYTSAVKFLLEYYENN